MHLVFDNPCTIVDQLTVVAVDLTQNQLNSGIECTHGNATSNGGLLCKHNLPWLAQKEESRVR